MRKSLIARLFVLAFLLPGPVCHGQGGKPMSVKEFLKLSSADTSLCILTGVVQKVRSTTSGSFYLEDPTGTVLIYGLAATARCRKCRCSKACTRSLTQKPSAW